MATIGSFLSKPPSSLPFISKTHQLFPHSFTSSSPPIFSKSKSLTSIATFERARGLLISPSAANTTAAGVKKVESDERVQQVHSIEEFNEALRLAKDKLVVVEYAASTSSQSPKIYPFVGDVLYHGNNHSDVVQLHSREDVEKFIDDHKVDHELIDFRDGDKCGRDYSKSVREVVQRDAVFTTRRSLIASLLVYSWYRPSWYLSAYALGDPSVTIEDVTPPVLTAGPLFPTEERIAELFEKNTYSVVNIFDVTLRPQLNVTGVVEIPEGNGSGVVWDEQGHIVTNYHVIGNSLLRNPSPGQVVARVNILTAEGVQKNFEGKLVGADRTKDLAVLKVEASEDLLKPIKVGQSLSLKVGQQCLAIGNPFGFDHTLTVGVISGLHRDIFSQTGVTIGGGIQTDAAINPGNSGGPLLDSKGTLIGINTAIFTQTGTSVGVGFAIPSSIVLKIASQLIQFGKVVRAGLNVGIAPVLVSNQLNVRNGALILQVPKNSVAAKAGLLSTARGFAGNIVLGDIILAVDNKPVRSSGELDKVLDDYIVGDKVTLKIQRGGEILEIPITLEEKNL